jgi:hypothetical protein
MFWDTMPRNQLRVNRSFGETYRLHLQGLRISRARNQRESRWYVPLKRRLTFNGLHGIASKKTELFITTAVRTSEFTKQGNGSIPRNRLAES